jgi:BolA family transcriptional regulator, general stress-responsive regulator
MACERVNVVRVFPRGGSRPAAVRCRRRPRGRRSLRVATELRRRLEAELRPERLEIEDQSARHAGHVGARPQGETHFRVLVVSPAFAGRGRVERQRLIYSAAADLLRTDIHALSVSALAPGEPGADAGSSGGG